LEVLNPIISDAGRSASERAAALLERGYCFGISGDYQHALTDFAAVATLKGVPKKQIAQALFHRGVAKVRLGDTQGALADYTEVVALEGASKEQVATALVCRGFANGSLGDTQGEMSDYTAVVKLEGAPKEQLALALLNRAVAQVMQRDIQGALADFKAVVALEGAPKEQVARALVGRGLSNLVLGKKTSAIEDWTAVLELEASFEDGLGMAADGLFRLYWLDGPKDKANNTLDYLVQHLASKPPDQRALKITEFLARLASPTMRQGWPHAARRLLGAQPPETRQALGFLEPLCAVMEGGEKSLLDPLPPEQREFALKVLARFDAAKNPPADPPIAVADSPKPGSKEGGKAAE
jgi:tetratricopeptide (TPR) repeat protein